MLLGATKMNVNFSQLRRDIRNCLPVWDIAAGAAVLVLVIGAASACGGTTKENSAAQPVDPVTVTAVPTATATITDTVTETAAPKPAAKPTKKARPVAMDHFVMPDEVGKSLQGAQDDLQE